MKQKMKQEGVKQEGVYIYIYVYVYVYTYVTRGTGSVGRGAQGQ